MKIGILGGTFDPIHNTHIYMAKVALKELYLDKVYLMPAFCPPHKNTVKITSENHRVDMIHLAIEGLEKIDYSGFEIEHQLSYTADTLTTLKEKYPEDEFFFIIGGDSISSFESWYHPETILEKASIVVIRRDDVTFDDLDQTIQDIASKFNHITTKYHTGIINLESEISDISSSFIRNHPLEECKGMLPPKVYDYIAENRLYDHCNKNTSWSLNEIKNDLKKVLNEHRYTHTLGVADTAKKMAEVFGVNPNMAYLAGILHDCAKNFSANQLIETCMENHIPISKYEQKAPYLLHGKVGAYVAETKYHIEDEEVLNAVKWHTTGKADMTKLEQIIFCADYIEPNRSVQPNLSYLREISLKDLDLLTYYIAKDTLHYLTAKGQIIDKYTEEVYQFYKEKVGEK